MTTKTLLKFYFNADGLNDVLDKFIFRAAANAFGTVEKTVREIDGITNKKRALALLWNFTDNAMGALSAEQIKALERYSAMRTGYNSLPDGERKLIKSALAKFCRRTAGIERFSYALTLVEKYVCLCRA